VGLPTHRLLRSLFCRRFVVENRGHFAAPRPFGSGTCLASLSDNRPECASLALLKWIAVQQIEAASMYPGIWQNGVRYFRKNLAESDILALRKGAVIRQL